MHFKPWKIERISEDSRGVDVVSKDITYQKLFRLTFVVSSAVSSASVVKTGSSKQNLNHSILVIAIWMKQETCLYATVMHTMSCVCIKIKPEKSKVRSDHTVNRAPVVFYHVLSKQLP